MSRTSFRRVLVVFNPTAGRRRRKRLDAVLAGLTRRGCRVTLRETTCAGDAERIGRTVSTADFDVVAAAGGDGTVNELANGLAQAEGAVPPLAVIPLGTANVLAAEIGLDNPEDIAETIAFGHAMAMRPGMVNGRRFLLMAGIGFDSWVVGKLRPRLKRLTGKLAYVAEALVQSLRYPFPNFRVTVDGREYRARGVVACKGRLYGGRFILAPRARLDQPSFEICLLAGGGVLDQIRYGIALALGRLSKLPDVTVVTGREVVVECDSALPIQCDGDILTALPANIVLADKPLSLLMPEKSAA
ncbi:diacylglycerol kinase family protein [Telmatospirillum sp. J64-1]|uniref:diacylglycerol/lipid kinase family protein n=1 Tax=Telmatospirillum sp. J64-1 TaxID=2502183 RepID=UPI002107D706|nr:diacylglycerol kinase family protein [Telmatospirillum sp. J64-1]